MFWKSGTIDFRIFITIFRSLTAGVNPIPISHFLAKKNELYFQMYQNLIKDSTTTVEICIFRFSISIGYNEVAGMALDRKMMKI